uniref:KH domain-containing protein n=1 Tax=Strongyloides papillosus TaxID=174720 RepID=A0A0N5BSS6_STREA
MSTNISSSWLNSPTEDGTERYYKKIFKNRNSLNINENYEYNKDYHTLFNSFHDQEIEGVKKCYTTIDYEVPNIRMDEAFSLPTSYQIPIERFYKIIYTITLMANNQFGSTLNLTRTSLTQKANDIVKKISSSPINDKQALRILDIQLQEIEEVTTNMARDLGLTMISTTTIRTLKEPKETYINMRGYSKTFNEIFFEPVLISDDKTLIVNRNYKCHKTGEVQVEIIKKINLKNCLNVNVIGKLIGPRGSTIKNLENSTQSKITIRGKGSMRNNILEEDLLRQGICDHLNEPLHILISVHSPSEVDCFRKLELVRKKLIFVLCQKSRSLR